MDENLIYLYMLQSFAGFGCQRIQRIWQRWKDWPAVCRSARWDDWKDLGISRDLFVEWRAYYRRERTALKKKWKILVSSGVRAISYWSEDYPQLLREIYSPPVILFYKGNLDCLSSKCLAVIGTRRSSDYGKRVVRSLVSSLTGYGWTVVSGMAFGIDSLAHWTAIRHGVLTIAVVGGSLDKAYPRSNQKLFDRIIDSGGLVLSEHDWDKVAEPWHFPARNRIVSGICQAVLVVEAPQKSGAKITARLALEQNRPVLVVPGSIYNSGSFGCNELIKEGAIPINSINDILLELGEKVMEKSVRYQAKNEIETVLLKQLKRGSQALDELNLKEVSAATILAHLNELQLKGVVVENKGRWELV